MHSLGNILGFFDGKRRNHLYLALYHIFIISVEKVLEGVHE
jgi:hypothetical protein